MEKTEARAVRRLVVTAAGAGLAMALASVAAAGPWQSGQRTAERRAADRRDGIRRPGPPPGLALPSAAAPPVLTGLDAGTASSASDAATSAASGPDVPAPTTQGLADAIGPLFDDPALGRTRTGAVLDAGTGQLLYGHDQDTASAPASTTKIATATAALEALGPGHRIATRVLPGAGPGTIVLVGGGDPTLTASPTPPGADPDATPASLVTLAADTAKALRARRTTEVTLTYDTSLYTGPVLHPIGVNDNIAPVTALMADEGRTDPASTEDAPRQADPAACAAQTFATLLGRDGITVRGQVKPGTAPAGTHAPLAQVLSMPLSALVERMLTDSDNDIAEALARQAALGTETPVSFTGGAQAVREQLTRLHAPLTGTAFNDGSGLDRADRLTPDLLAHLLLDAASPAHPELRSVLSGLPVAGFTGTLADRFQSGEDDTAAAGGPPSSAAGLVRAKTGTLTGVNTLAGTVVDGDGRLLVFAFMTSGTTDPDAAQGALDRLASAVTGCGCR
ncbi:D-alanyl-D-alanine carboxypeptidase/D-alanyl-D-alanine endopeptidase [Streptantibioticus parmotrematis]|nr:D-alanyl-D-alanine carboxypeptidase/D-alanyl-D-alanine-endopeptidase [Streptantibioticus parmotrematis]